MDSKLPEYQPVSIELQTEPPDPTIVVPVSSSCMCLTIFSLAAEAHPILIDSGKGGPRGTWYGCDILYGGTNYSATDGPGGPFLRGEHPWRHRSPPTIGHLHTEKEAIQIIGYTTETKADFTEFDYSKNGTRASIPARAGCVNGFDNPLRITYFRTIAPSKTGQYFFFRCMCMDIL